MKMGEFKVRDHGALVGHLLKTFLRLDLVIFYPKLTHIYD